MNLLRDPELLDLIKSSGCIGVYIGLESVVPESLAQLSKSFNKPEHYADILVGLHRRGITTMTGFIFGIDADLPGVARKTWEVVNNWSPEFFPIFSQLTPLPGTPLYKKLLAENRLEDRHWMNHRPYAVVFEPKSMTPQRLEREIAEARQRGYSPESILDQPRRMRDQTRFRKLVFLFSTPSFRGLYFRQIPVRAWLRVLWRNRRALREAFSAWASEPVSRRELSARNRAYTPSRAEAARATESL